jgi:flagellar basal body-associated protein FliL
MDSQIQPEANPSQRRRLLIVGAAAAALALLGGGGWFAYDRFLAGDAAEVAAPGGPAAGAPLDALFTQLPEITTGLPEARRVARLGLVLETGRETPAPAEAQVLHITEEVRRWVAARDTAELEGPAALWTVRARSLAIARQLYPELAVRDVLIRVLLVQ